MISTGWPDASNILCVRLDNLGDVLMMTPAMRALKGVMPQRRITLLASDCGAIVAPHVPELDDMIAYAAPWMKSSERCDADSDLAMARVLRQRQFDAAVIFTSYSQSPLPAAMLCHLADIPLRLAHCHENPYHLLTDWIPDPEPHEHVRHEVRRQLDLVAAVDARTSDERLSFRVPPEELAWALQRLQAMGIGPAQSWVLLHPGASAPSRRYPPLQWAEAADRLAAQTGCALVFTGSAQESVLVEQIRSAMTAASHSLAGALSLGKFGAMIGLAPAIISNNSSPVHLAAALGTPVVDLYALTNPQHTPWQTSSRVLFHDVPCRNCYKSICPQGHHHCLGKVTPARVADSAIELLNGEFRLTDRDNQMQSAM